MKTPKHLSVEAKKIYRALVTEYAIRDEGGLRILTAGLEAFDRAKKARAQIEKVGMVFDDRFNQPRVNPLCAVERDARAQWLRALQLLNLDIKGENHDDEEI